MKLSDISRTDLTNTDVQSTTSNIKSKPTTVSEHFLSHSNHSHTDMQLIPLEKIHSSRDSVRKARESHLIDKTMTLESRGLNHRNELLYYCIIEFVFFLSSFCVVRHFRLSLLNNLYCDIHHLYNIVVAT